jgi:hypothetical protein
VIDASANDLKPVIDAQRRLMALWSCSTMLLRYLLQRASTYPPRGIETGLGSLNRAFTIDVDGIEDRRARA